MTGPRKRVLLVDDDAEILEVTRMALEEHGYEVLLAHDGAEALMRGERDAPDLIILDVVMPKRSGFAVLKRLRSRHGGSPRIIVMTANDPERYKAHAESHGADAFLPKPFDIDQLLIKVDSLLGS